MERNTIIQKKSLAQEVANRLQSEISAGVLKAGDKLPTEPMLMNAYGVGRSTIREAVKILSYSGHLRVQQGKGTFVESSIALNEPINLRLKRADVDHLDEVRQILEVKIAEIAAQRRTVEDLANIEKSLLERNAAIYRGSFEESIEADIRFHASIAEATHNEILIELYKLISLHLKERYSSEYENTNSFENTQRLHKKLFDHITAADSQKALKTACEILDEP